MSLSLSPLSHFNMFPAPANSTPTFSFLNAHETTAVDPFAIALLCGDVRAELYSGVLVLDGNRARFAVGDWKAMLVLKVLRARLKELLTRSFKSPGRSLTAQQEKWLDVWQKIFVLANENREAALKGN